VLEGAVSATIANRSNLLWCRQGALGFEASAKKLDVTDNLFGVRIVEKGANVVDNRPHSGALFPNLIDSKQEDKE